MTAHIFTAEDKYLEIPGLEGMSPPERVVARFWSGFKYLGLPTKVSEQTASPFVNHGRWVVRCPWCPGAQEASKTDPRFFCDECGNNGEGWVNITWPDETEEIELALGRRPDRLNRNWVPPETVADLWAENDEHGVH